MATLQEVREEIVRYANEKQIWAEIGGLYDLLPANPGSPHGDVAVRWPARWPNGTYQGVYLFFDAEGASLPSDTSASRREKHRA